MRVPGKLLVFCAAAAPAAWLPWLAVSGGLGADPVKALSHYTGDWTLNLLLATLAVTPLRRLSGRVEVMRYRRMLGLFTFFYACLHFLTWLVLDQFFDWQAIVADVVKRPYISVGFAAFVLLLPLALTSTRRMAMRLGRNWRRLHRLAYAAALGGVLHFLWLVKADVREPLIYLAILLLLFLARVPFVADRLSRPYGAGRDGDASEARRVAT